MNTTQEKAKLTYMPGRYARQLNPKPFDYDQKYWKNQLKRDGSDEAEAIDEARLAMLERFKVKEVLEVGVGSGRFLCACLDDGIKAEGYDINPYAVDWLKSVELEKSQPIDSYQAVMMWDVIEHVEDPMELIGGISVGQLLFLSLPIFDDISKVEESKHYKPDEHLWYWTPFGLIDWMWQRGFHLQEYCRAEEAAGREGIGSFVFLRRDHGVN